VEFALVTSDSLPPLRSIELDVEIPKDNLEVGWAASANKVVFGSRIPGVEHLTLTGNPYLVAPGGVLATLRGIAVVSRDSTGPIQLRNLLVDGSDPALIPCSATLAAASSSDAIFTALPVCGSEEIRHYLRTGGQVKGMTITPNPASHDIVIDVNVESASSAELRVVDALGLERLHMNVDLHAGENRITADVSALTSGAYITQLHTPNGSARAPLVKVH
jgi:hypothetical protein